MVFATENQKSLGGLDCAPGAMPMLGIFSYKRGNICKNKHYFWLQLQTGQYMVQPNLSYLPQKFPSVSNSIFIK